MSSTTQRRYDRLVGAVQITALTDGFLQYTDLAKIIGAFPGSSMMNSHLKNLMLKNQKNGEPLFCSLVVNAEGKPGPGFFELAQELGYTWTNPLEFWLSMVKKSREHMRKVSTKGIVDADFENLA